MPSRLPPSLLNYMCKAKVAKKNFDYLYYTTPNEAAMKLIEKKYRNEDAIFPTDETLDMCDTLKTLDTKTTDLYSKYWKEVKAK